MRRRALLATSAASGGGDNIFPMYLYTEKINSWTYSHGPSPESIAFTDYYLANAEYDSMGGHVLNLPEGCLYIDGVCVRTLYGYNEDIEMMVPFPKYFATQSIWWSLKGTYKGQLSIYNDD
jgi:hypothetical protein